MRRAFNAKLIYHESKFLGINLGYDYCAEHEWGIEGLENAFGLNPALMGVQRYQNSVIPNGPYCKLQPIEFTDRKTPWVGLYFNAKQYFEMDRKELKKHMPLPFKNAEDEICSAWDQNSFAIVVHKTNKWVINEILDAINRNDLAIGIGANTNPYSRGGLQLMIVSYMPQEMKDAILESHEDYDKLMKAVKKTNIENILKNANKRYYALSPQWYSPNFKPNGRELETKHKVIFFLNPHEQSKYNYGWFTVEELIDWTKETGPIPKNPLPKSNKKSVVDVIRKLF